MTLEEIRDILILNTSISRTEFHQKKTSRKIGKIKRVFYLLARYFTTSTYEEIGSFTQRNPNYLSHAVNGQDIIKEDILEEYNRIKKIIKNGT